MRVLQLAKYFPPVPGGIETFVQDLSHALVRESHQNLVLAHRSEKSGPTEITGPAGTVAFVPSLGQLFYAPIAPSYPLHLRARLRSFAPDLLLVHMPNVSGFWPLLLRPPCPLVIYWHADVLFPAEKKVYNIAYRAYSIFERRLLERAAAIIVTSPPYLEHSRPLRPFHDKCRIVPLGIDIERIPDQDEATAHGVSERLLGRPIPRYILAAGRFAHYKGFDILVEAAAKVRRTHPEIRFVIAGDGETRIDVLRRIHDLDLEKYVHCPGRVTDAEYWALMRECEIFCLPSTQRTEAFGIVLLEAMMLGKPCISTAIPGSGTGWINRHEETGLVVEPNDPDMLAEALRKCLDDSSASYGKRGIESAIRIDDSVQALQDIHNALHHAS